MSVRFNVYSYSGGAHGFEYASTVNFAPALGRALEVGNMLDAAAFGTAAQLCAKQIRQAKRQYGVDEASIAEASLPWHVTRLGCRAEYLFGPDRPRNGSEAHACADFGLERFMHLHALNRGVLLTPFHNMALMSPATTEADVDRHTEVFREAALELAG